MNKKMVSYFSLQRIWRKGKSDQEVSIGASHFMSTYKGLDVSSLEFEVFTMDMIAQYS